MPKTSNVTRTFYRDEITPPFQADYIAIVSLPDAYIRGMHVGRKV